jgi:plasmid stability protein
MKNITLKVDDATYQRARIRAAEAGTSVSAMVREFLNSDDATSGRESQRIEAMQALFALAETQADYNVKPVQPLSRDEIYNERLH